MDIEAGASPRRHRGRVGRPEGFQLPFFDEKAINLWVPSENPEAVVEYRDLVENQPELSDLF
jgi:hypothetical protein